MRLPSLLVALNAFFIISQAAPAAVDLGRPAESTPYDRYMTPVKRVLRDLHRTNPDFGRVQTLVRIGRSFRYSFTEPYVAALPAVTAQTRSGDCKAKSLWLAAQLDDSRVRYVIGKARVSSPLSHAWLLWNDGKAWWILDPTNNTQPILAESVARDEYIPLYSWSKDGAYRHSGNALRMVAAQAASESGAPGTGEQR